MTRMRVHIVLLLLLGPIAGCSSSSLDGYPGLEQRLADYYELEKQGKWEEAWTYRVPAYRQSVPLKNYVAAMSRDADGWVLRDVKIRRVVKQGNLVHIDMEFIEVPPEKWAPAPGITLPVRELFTEDRSVWELIDGKWQAWETGDRGRLALNAALVPPNNTVETDARKSGARGSP